MSCKNSVWELARKKSESNDTSLMFMEHSWAFVMYLGHGENSALGKYRTCEVALSDRWIRAGQTLKCMEIIYCKNVVNRSDTNTKYKRIVKNSCYRLFTGLRGTINRKNDLLIYRYPLALHRSIAETLLKTSKWIWKIDHCPLKKRFRYYLTLWNARQTSMNGNISSETSSAHDNRY